MKPLPLKPTIDNHIVTFFDTLRVGDLIKTEDVWKYVKRNTGKQMDRGTVNRYMRQLRQDEVINYNCYCKFRRQMQVIEMGKPHSR